MAVRYQAYSTNTITVLLLDEVGLAEHSPDMPLKCLHGMLVDPPISIVGLSNWVLDPAKMNRAILVQRPQPDNFDISLTGYAIMGLSEQSEDSPLELEVPSSPSHLGLLDVLPKIASAYHKAYTHQKGRDFVGMRDYYSMIKHLREVVVESNSAKFVTKEDLVFSLFRNFGGRHDLLCGVLESMCRELFSLSGDLSDLSVSELAKTSHFSIPKLDELILANLDGLNSRHLMLLTKNSHALFLLNGMGILDPKRTKVIVGSNFDEDKNELYVIQQLNEVKRAMAKGERVVLLNAGEIVFSSLFLFLFNTFNSLFCADNMYEALYDVLNMRYLVKRDQLTGEKTRLLRIAIGTRSALCPVAGLSFPSIFP